MSMAHRIHDPWMSSSTFRIHTAYTPILQCNNLVIIRQSRHVCINAHRHLGVLRCTRQYKTANIAMITNSDHEYIANFKFGRALIILRSLSATRIRITNTAMRINSDAHKFGLAINDSINPNAATH